MNNLFEILGIHIFDTEETSDTIVLRAIPDEQLIFCPSCNLCTPIEMKKG